MSGGSGRGAADSAKLAMLERYGPEMLATARRYAPSPHDAEDACQRAAEILLTHEPRGTDDELCRWLRTVVKHEALAIRRQRQRVVPAGGADRVPEPPSAQPETHERAERLERLQLGAQAIARLKPQEVRCLLLRAEGYSYKEICAETGWTYTKVNRCLAEGRRAFLERVKGIESGAECKRLAPHLSALADGEATADDLAALRPHLKGCLGCRARLRDYRSVPSRVAALAPPAALAGSGDGGQLRGLIESVVGAVQERAAAFGERAHHATELAAGGKVAAVAASAAALAGGGAATVEHLSESAADAGPSTRVRPAKEEVASPAPAPAAAPAPADPAAPTEPSRAAAPAPTPEPAPAPPPNAANEFAPEAAATIPASPAPAPAPARAPAGEFEPGGSGGAGNGEFAP